MLPRQTLLRHINLKFKSRRPSERLHEVNDVKIPILIVLYRRTYTIYI